MLDTVKVAIPITRAQHTRIHTIAKNRDTWNWALQNQLTGELLCKRYEALVQTDGESYHREIRFHYPPVWDDLARLWLEFSVPKYWYGHNVHMLNEWVTALKDFRRLLVQQFELKRLRFPEVETWEVWRADCCYAYRFPSQQVAQAYLDSIKRQRFPRKQPVIHPTSIFWGGGTYSLKIYLKRPEFEAHDKPALIKDKAALEWVEHLEQLADGIFRVEATLRRKYLQRMEVKTIADLAATHTALEWDEVLYKTPGFDWVLSALTIAAKDCAEAGITDIRSDGNRLPLANGVYYHAPEGYQLETPWLCYIHPGGGYIYRSLPRPLFKLRELMHRLLGGMQGMDTIDRVEAILMQHYKPVKAANLVSFWLYIKQFGHDKAKDVFGKDAYYYKRRELKKAGVGLVEASENIIKVDAEFFRNFKLDIPSSHATNVVDDFRDHGNVLNLLPTRNEA